MTYLDICSEFEILKTSCKPHNYEYGHAWVNQSLTNWLNQNSVNYNIIIINHDLNVNKRLIDPCVTATAIANFA